MIILALPLSSMAGDVKSRTKIIFGWAIIGAFAALVFLNWVFVVVHKIFKIKLHLKQRRLVEIFKVKEIENVVLQCEKRAL